ncbi:MAG TPA: MBL fold metallo-hydrolase [Gaiellaceae bacterium]|nr:MBL fold metallo-hydrolase [Gaiellaceae bacterium]
MRLTIWGCRGSVPTPGPATVRYGGNTSCVEVALRDQAALVLDAGTGIRPLGLELARRATRRIHLLLTHLHLDHLEGLRFFAPLWDPEVVLDIWGPPSPVLSLRERIARSFSPPLFPVDLNAVPAQVTFHDIPREPWTVDGISLAADLVLHPGPTVGFRIESEESSVAYLPDHEPALAGAISETPTEWMSGASVATDADVLLHDAQYFEDEYAERIGWGHSSVADAVGFTRAVGAHSLVLFHHEPAHADGALELLEARAQSLAGGNGIAPRLAHEGMVLELP